MANMLLEQEIQIFGIAHTKHGLKGDTAGELDPDKAVLYPPEWKGGLIIIPTESNNSTTHWEKDYQAKPFTPQQGIIELTQGCGVIGIVHNQRRRIVANRPLNEPAFFSYYSPNIITKTQASECIQGPRYKWEPHDLLIHTIGGILPMQMRIVVLESLNVYVAYLGKKGALTLTRKSSLKNSPFEPRKKSRF